jgi:hypothetical protein
MRGLHAHTAKRGHRLTAGVNDDRVSSVIPNPDGHVKTFRRTMANKE